MENQYLPKPMPGKVLVKVEQNSNVLSNGMVIPESAVEKSSVGEVIAVGEGVCQKPLIEPGVKVLYAKHAGTELTIHGQQTLLLRDADIFLVL